MISAAGSYWFVSNIVCEMLNARMIIYCQNAMVPHGVLVNNSAINTKTSQFLSYVLTHQDSTGWLGPEVGTTKPRYLWGRYASCNFIFARYSLLFVFEKDIPSCLVQSR